MPTRCSLCAVPRATLSLSSTRRIPLTTSTSPWLIQPGEATVTTGPRPSSTVVTSAVARSSTWQNCQVGQPPLTVNSRGASKCLVMTVSTFGPTRAAGRTTVIARPGWTSAAVLRICSTANRSPTCPSSGSAAKGASSGSGTTLAGDAPYVMALVTTTRRATPVAAAEITTVWIWRTARSRRVRALCLRSAERSVLAATWIKASTSRRELARSGEPRSTSRQWTPSAAPRSASSPTTVPMAPPAAERASRARTMWSPSGVAAPVTATVIAWRRERTLTRGELTATSACLPLREHPLRRPRSPRVRSSRTTTGRPG